MSNDNLSYAEQLIYSGQWEKYLKSLSPKDLSELKFIWEFWARPKQLPPQWAWRVWMLLCGRGWGKTRVGAEWVRYRVEKCGAKRIALVGRTAADVRDVMVEGESGLLGISRPDFMPVYKPSIRELEWPNGAIAKTFSADEPNVLRGPQHDTAWCDELASWPANEAWSNLEMGLRLGTDPRVIVTTTPRPIPIVKDILKRPTTAATIGNTFENKSNLAESFIDNIKRQYEGTRLGRQELYAEILDDNPGALWHMANIDEHRKPEAPQLTRIVVAIDPAVSSNVDSDETGLVVAGSDGTGHAYVLHDESGIYSPSEWGHKAVELYDRFEADCIIAEVNNGGELVKQNVYTVRALLPFKEVRATRGKQLRAEPVAALYEQGRVHHVGSLSKLEDQMCSWDPTMPGKSPDRLDAMVWAVTDLLVGTYPAPRKPGVIREFKGMFHDEGSGW